MGRKTMDNKKLDELGYERILVLMTFMGDMTMFRFAKALGIKINHLRVLLNLYLYDRPMRMDELGGLRYRFHHKRMLILETRGHIESELVHGVKMLVSGEVDADFTRYSLTYEGRVLVECYYGAINKVMDKFREYNMHEVFSDIDEVIKLGFSEFGYDLDNDIFGRDVSSRGFVVKTGDEKEEEDEEDY